jgi:hypothetical protein
MHLLESDMIELEGKPANLFFTIEVKRAATGKTETFEMIGHADPEELKKLTETQGVDHGRDPQ